MKQKLQKQICRNAGTSLAASREPMAHRRKVTSSNLFYRYYFGRRSSGYQDVCVNSFFSRAT